MRILIDENLPRDLILELTEDEVATVQGLGWSGVTNGELLRRAAGRFDPLVTMDRELEHQQAVRDLTFGIMVVRAKSNRMAHLRPLVPDILAALALVRPGEIRHVGG